MLQFMHLYAFPAKENAANQRSSVERAERRFEQAAEEEREAHAALQAATVHRQAVEADVKQARAAILAAPLSIQDKGNSIDSIDEAMLADGHSQPNVPGVGGAAASSGDHADGVAHMATLPQAVSEML